MVVVLETLRSGDTINDRSCCGPRCLSKGGECLRVWGPATNYRQKKDGGKKYGGTQFLLPHTPEEFLGWLDSGWVPVLPTKGL